MNAKIFLSAFVVALASAGCDAPPTTLVQHVGGPGQVDDPGGPNQTDDPTRDSANRQGAYAGGPDNTYDHADDLGAFGGRNPFDILAQRTEEGPPEVRTRLHSCQKIP